VVIPLIVGTGSGVTVTPTVAVPVHPPALVAVTVYVVFATGLTVIAVVTADVFHK
jgi:hypothetical protein